jgi:RNA polymerase sigma factor (sigma-70 family)
MTTTHTLSGSASLTRSKFEPHAGHTHAGTAPSPQARRRRDPHGPRVQRGRQRLGADSVARLVSLAAAGDQRAWDRLIEEFGGMIRAVARAHRLSDADAADVAQVTWMRLLGRLGQLRDPANVGAWLATTARRECLRVLRESRREVPLGDDRPEQTAGDPPLDSAVLTAERDEALWRAFARLRQSDQALLGMLMAEPAPCYEEVSAALGMPIGSIGPTRARALERLRSEIGRQGSLVLLAH